MIIPSNIDFVYSKTKSVITVGTFDGFHSGHKKLFHRVKELAEREKFSSIAITFNPHPRSVLSNDNKVKLLTTISEKTDLIKNCDIENLVIINFTKEFAKTSYEKFVEEILVGKFNLGIFVIGHDHKFGKDREGDEIKLKELAQKYNFDVEIVEPILIDNEIISSTKIRECLRSGDIKKANNFISREYAFSGKVVHGATRGRLLGFPTANILPMDENKLIPQNGVYAVRCSMDSEEYFGVMNIGFRPTFEIGNNLVIEVHIFNFNQEIYDREITISFIDRLRDEKKFFSKEELIYQIERDKKKAIQIIGKLIN